MSIRCSFICEQDDDEDEEKELLPLVRQLVDLGLLSDSGEVEESSIKLISSFSPRVGFAALPWRARRDRSLTQERVVGDTSHREYATNESYEIHEALGSGCHSAPVGDEQRVVRADRPRQRYRFGSGGGSIRAGARR